MKKKGIIITISVIAFLIVAFFVVVPEVIFRINNKRLEWESVDHWLRKINSDWKPEILVYGEDYDFRPLFTYVKIDEITEDSIGEFGNRYKVIVLMDINGTMVISDDELLLIKRLCEEKGLDMLYLGENTLEDFARLEFTYQLEDDELGFSYLGTKYYGEEAPDTPHCNWYASHGLYLEDYGTLQDVKRVQVCLFSSILDGCIRFNEAIQVRE